MKKNATDGMLTEIFCRKVHELGEQNGLSPEEQTRIITVFRQAMANSYMDEQQIYQKLGGGNN